MAMAPIMINHIYRMLTAERVYRTCADPHAPAAAPGWSQEWARCPAVPVVQRAGRATGNRVQGARRL